MGFIKRRLIFFISRWLMRRSWGRRILWLFAMQALRSRVRQFVSEMSELYPALRPAKAWI
jgi:hypothetical protein